MDFSLDDIAEFLAACDDGSLRNQRVLDSLEQRWAEIDRLITDLLALWDTPDLIP